MKKLKRIFAISILVGILYGYCCLIMATYNNVEEYKYKRLYNMTKDYVLAIESTEEIVEDIEIERIISSLQEGQFFSFNNQVSIHLI